MTHPKTPILKKRNLPSLKRVKSMNNDIIERYYELQGLNSQSVIDGLVIARDDLSGKNINVESLIIEHPLTDEEKPRIAVLFYELDEEDIENQKDYLAFAKEDYISEDKVSMFINEERLQYAQIYNSPDDLDQLSSMPKLLQNVIDYLKTKPNNEVLDLLYIDHTNSDALHVPSVRVYSLQG